MHCSIIIYILIYLLQCTEPLGAETDLYFYIPYLSPLVSDAHKKVWNKGLQQIFLIQQVDFCVTYTRVQILPHHSCVNSGWAIIPLSLGFSTSMRKETIASFWLLRLNNEMYVKVLEHSKLGRKMVNVKILPSYDELPDDHDCHVWWIILEPLP